MNDLPMNYDWQLVSMGGQHPEIAWFCLILWGCVPVLLAALALAAAMRCGAGGFTNQNPAWLPVIALAWLAWLALVVVPNLVRRNAA